MSPSKRIKKEPTVSPYFIKKTEAKEKVEVKKESSIKKDTKREPVIKKEEGISLLEDKGVQDILDYDLKVLFVGINPGLTSTAKGHHYAGPTNHFWPCLSVSGLVDRKVTFEEDQELPRRYRLGFTNLTARTTRKASELTLKEQRQGIPVLNHKCETLRPRVACFIGKGIYEIYAKQKCSHMGLQAHATIPWLNGQGETVIFVMPSTSGIVSAYQKPDKIK